MEHIWNSDYLKLLKQHDKQNNYHIYQLVDTFTEKNKVLYTCVVDEYGDFIKNKYEKTYEMMIKLVGHEFIPKSSTEITKLQYKNLRDNFSKIIDNVLGFNYYNYGMDVYSCDDMSTEDIINKFKDLKDELKYSTISCICFGILSIVSVGYVSYIK